MKHFTDQILAACAEKQSIACVGLDPQIAHIPGFLLEKHSPADALLAFNQGIIDAVADLVPVVKLQSAFYELLGADGVRVFHETLKYAKSKGLLTIADAKRNDIGHSAQAYADAFLGQDGFDADSVTVTPYLGYDGVKPFLEVARKNGKGVFILVKTSNPSSGDFQDLIMKDKSEAALFEIVGQFVDSWGANDTGESGYSCLGAVVGATFPDQAKRLRTLMPQTLFLVPGYGAQGGTAADVKVCLNEDGKGAIVNSSRGIIGAWEKRADLKPQEFAKAAREAVEVMNADLKF
ncbi:MAG: orotidine-5'-phosphate decarboxylase [Patescibacteria group bacterium]